MANETDAPLGLFFDHSNKVLLVTFCRAFTQHTTTALNKAAKAVVERHGHVAVILDFSEVTEFAIQLRDWPELGNNRRTIRGKRRMFVAPQTPIFSPLRLYGTHRADAGDDTDVVATRSAAYRGLDLVDPQFEPLEFA